LPIERFVARGVDVVGVEGPHMRQQGLGEVSALDLVVAERLHERARFERRGDGADPLGAKQGA
jgi:hypothetical protein